MSDRNYTLYLQDIVESGTAIQYYVQHIDYEQFSSERMRYAAVIREFEIIGEAVSKLPESIKSQAPDTSWQDIKDFRNLLAHEYFGVDLQIVWTAIIEDLPNLLTAVKQLLNAKAVN